MSLSLDPHLATRFASLALGHVRREYPNKLDHVMAGPQDVRSPRELHPVFYGSFDWHSCVHGYWLLLSLYRRFPELGPAAEIRRVMDDHLVNAKVEQELTYLRRPEHAGFERPYGWAWLLKLASELARHESPEGRRWFRALEPLAEEFAARFIHYLPKATYPIRAGTHANTAFAVTLALDYTESIDPVELAELLRDRALSWYGGDADARPWEPSGEDFLSPTLMEMECMRRVLPRDRFAVWLERFLPRLEQREPRAIFTPAVVSDRTDGRIVHLDGLNLSRAWCWASLARAWPGGHPIRTIALTSADDHLRAALPNVSGDYMGEHWLASFALLALDARDLAEEVTG